MSATGPAGGPDDLARAADELAATAAQGQADVERPTRGHGDPAGSDVEGEGVEAEVVEGEGVAAAARPGGEVDPDDVAPDDVAPGPDVERGPAG